MIVSGKLNQYASLQKPVESTLDAHGGITRSWLTVAQRWVAIQPLTGRELIEAQRVQERTTTRIIVEWDPDIAAIDGTWRLSWDDPRTSTRNWEFLAIVNTEQLDRELEILAVEAGP